MCPVDGTFSVLQICLLLYRRFQADLSPEQTLRKRGIPHLQRAGFRLPVEIPAITGRSLWTWELIAFTLLRDDDEISVVEYESFRIRGGVMQSQAVLQQHKLEAPWCHVAHPLLSCWCWVYGPVGLYWILPLWMAMYLEASDWDVSEQTLECEPSERTLCPGLPRNCATAVHRVSSDDWEAYHELHHYFMAYQCDSFEADESLYFRFPYPLALGSLYPKSPDGDHTLFLVVSAGVLLASAIVEDSSAEMWYVLLLCSAKRSGGGSALLKHLQFIAPVGLSLVSVPCAVDFYVTQGFVPIYEDDAYQLVHEVPC